mmetsp:Transcript_18476/g.50808  ORF Transcript_18476/g.50808 Transcript_18476/m.50808 type:complete len:202 (-) Transcript_18476:1010-1615(-)
MLIIDANDARRPSTFSPPEGTEEAINPKPDDGLREKPCIRRECCPPTVCASRPEEAWPTVGLASVSTYPTPRRRPRAASASARDAVATSLRPCFAPLPFGRPAPVQLRASCGAIPGLPSACSAAPTPPASASAPAPRAAAARRAPSRRAERGGGRPSIPGASAWNSTEAAPRQELVLAVPASANQQPTAWLPRDSPSCRAW